jgi:phenylalanine-4-hydroxylase
MRVTNSASEEKITEIFNQLKTNFSHDWLLNLEIYEVALQNNYALKSLILERLEALKCNKSYTKLIENGLVLCKNQ